MKYDHPEVIDPALAVIKQYDPALHAQMLASDWDVHLVTDLGHDPCRMSHPGESEVRDFSDGSGTVALTSVILAGRPTDVDLHQAIAGASADQASSLARYLAFILVHEFAHHQGHDDESGPYHAGTVFARKMGEDLMAEDSEAGEQEASFSDLLESLFSKVLFGQ